MMESSCTPRQKGKACTTMHLHLLSKWYGKWCGPRLHASPVRRAFACCELYHAPRFAKSSRTGHTACEMATLAHVAVESGTVLSLLRIGTHGQGTAAIFVIFQNKYSYVFCSQADPDNFAPAAVRAISYACPRLAFSTA